ncbi:MAG: DNA repair protein RecN [Ruminococcaceae bacterium]|nr:DNA repair protein RecN [Oscillospiraceae bacterium]
MLEVLHIENIAVVKKIDIEFSAGMTVLTGETGAGKSIIVDSLNLISGARAEKELIRRGETRAEVSALFSQLDSNTVQKIRELGFECEDGSVLISRAFTAASSTARVNGAPITLMLLKKLSALLFGIHGQNDNMLLSEPKNHLNILDTYAGNKGLLEVYEQKYQKVFELRKKLKALSDDLREQMRQSEVLRFQINDIESVKLKEGEEEELQSLVLRLRGLEKINKSCTLVTRALEGGKGMGAIYLVDRASVALDAISDTVSEAESLAARLSEVKYELEDIAGSVSSLCDIDGDPSIMLDKAESRLDAILKLKRKYGSTVEEILAFRDDAKTKLDFIEHADDIRMDIENELIQIESEAKKAAAALTESRRAAAHGLTRKVCESLAFLDMPKVKFEASLKPLEDFSKTGRDSVEFLISANAGEPLLPMAKIASGGELARIMLSLKNEINICDGIDTVVFDEIDTGISGKTSRKVGMKLKEIGRSAQVICVTHSAQIASLANNHLFVSKNDTNGRTESAVKALSEAERVDEIARILGGIEITKVQREAAEELLRDGAEYR